VRKLQSNFRQRLLALAATTGVLLAIPSPAAAAPAAPSRLGADCARQLDRVSVTLLGANKPDSAQLQKLKSCVLSTPWVAGTLAQAGQASQAAAASDGAAASVVASFRNAALCLQFNGDGTISGRGPLSIVQSGGYIGIPGVFSVFSYAAQLDVVIIDSFGLNIGPITVEFWSARGSPVPPIVFGAQVTDCAT
jgi:hypothetical protein